MLNASATHGGRLGQSRESNRAGTKLLQALKKKKESNSADVPCIVLIWNSFELQRLATGG